MKRRYQLAYEQAAAEGKVPKVKFLHCGGSVIRRVWSERLPAWVERPLAPQFCGVSSLRALQQWAEKRGMRIVSVTADTHSTKVAFYSPTGRASAKA